MQAENEFRLVRRIGFALFFALIASVLAAGSLQSDGTSEPPATRDPQQWPFVWDSIWNIPIGANAQYVPAGIQPAGRMTADEDIIILEPDAPQVDVIAHDAGWDLSKTRCGSIVTPIEVLINGAPIPNAFSTDPGHLGETPNHSAVILMPDGVTIKQTQPFHRCGTGGVAVSQYNSSDDDIKTGDGIHGAHGGSGMSSLGGTIRMGELVPGGVIRHVLKLNLYAKKYLYYDASDSTPGHRWPAPRADGYAGDPSHPCSYGGTVSELQMGALLALRTDFDIDGLQTQPAKIIARALINYGGYVVDDTCWDVYALETEWGADGRVIDEFEQVWGFPFVTSIKSTCNDVNDDECKWAKDMVEVFTNLHVIDNNCRTSIGGPGERRTSCAPPFSDGTGAPPIGSVCNPSVCDVYLPITMR